MLNGLWLGLFPVAATSVLTRWLIGSGTTMFAAIVENLLTVAKLMIEMMVLLFGTLALQLSLLYVAEKAGLVECPVVLLGPLFRRLIPEVPPGHPAISLITLNFIANDLGLDNIATPIGLKVMKVLQKLNPSSTTTSNTQILSLVPNTSPLVLLPVTTFMYRAQRGMTGPTLVFLPILLATSISTLTGLLSVALMQRLHLWDPVVLAYLIPGVLLLAGFMAVLGALSATALAQLSPLLDNLALSNLTTLLLIVGTLKKVPVYESFAEGAKEGFDVVRNLLSYLVAMLCAAGMLRASRVLEMVLSRMRWAIEELGWNNHFVEVLPTALVRSFSDSTTRAMLLEIMQAYDVDSSLALAATTVWGSTETIFYVFAVYFGSVGLQRVCHTADYALIVDLARAIASIGACYWFFA